MFFHGCKELFSLQAEGGAAVHHYSFDRDWLGLCQTHPLRQGQKDLHDCHPSTGTPSNFVSLFFVVGLESIQTPSAFAHFMFEISFKMFTLKSFCTINLHKEIHNNKLRIF